ncbi:MAG: hypothetical protein AAF902_25270 [Chloroflexota bacterium]
MKFSILNEAYKLEVGSTGHSNGRILVFRFPNELDEWEQVGNARVLVIGGREARNELKRLLVDVGRPTLKEWVPDGISSSVHTALREYAGL